MAKKISTKSLRIAILAVVIFLFLGLIVSTIILKTRKPAVKQRAAATPAFAPSEYVFREDPKYLSNGYLYSLNDSAQLELIAPTGERYMLSQDGTVYRISEDGALSLEDNSDSILSALESATLASHEDAEINHYFDDYVLSGFNQETIEESEEKNNQYSPLLLSDLEKTLEGTDITLAELIDALEESGVSPEEYLLGYAAMKEKERVEEVGALSEVITGNTSALTISLGGNGAKDVADKEATYRSTYPSASELASAFSGISTTSIQNPTEYETQNDQSGKLEFMADFQNRRGTDQLTKNDIAPSTVISMILKTGINTDLPGQIVAEVTQNVYDSLTGSILLIPKGTRLLATYSSSVSFGQKRALVAWTQLIRPDGFILNLPGLPGIDGQGYAGYNDKVNTHFWELVGYAGLASIIDLGTQEIQGLTDSILENIDTISTDILNSVASSYLNQVSTAGQELIKQAIKRQPTLTIRPGRTIKLLVTEKLTLPVAK